MLRKLRRQQAIDRSSWGIARLFSGDLSALDEARMEAWRAESPQYEARFNKTLQLLADMEPLAGDPELLGLVQSPRSKAQGQKREFLVSGSEFREEEPTTRNQKPGTRNSKIESRKAWAKSLSYALAASLLVAVAISALLFYQPAEPSGRPLLYLTRVGEQKTLHLADGSEVVLNTDSRLLVDFSDQKRRLTLDHGEAYFDVASDPARPFTVEVGERSVSALGTAFSIRKSPERFTLAVVEGAVSLHQQAEAAAADAPLLAVTDKRAMVQNSGGQVRLDAGMVAEFDIGRQQLLAYKTADIDRLTRWRTGVMRFDAEPLYKVVLELNRYSGKKILIEDADIMALEVYAAIKLDRINVALTSLERALPIKAVQYSDRIVLTRR